MMLLLALKQNGLIGKTEISAEKYAATTTDSTTGAEISDAKPIFSTFKPTDTAPTSTATVDSVTLTLQQKDQSLAGLNTSKTVYRKSENSDMSSAGYWQSSNVSLSTAKTYYFQSQVTDNCGNTTTSQIKSQTTVAKSITVYFHPNGGSGTDGQTQTFTYGVANQKFAAKNFSRTGYTQGKWAESSSGSGVYDITSGVSDSWIESKYSNTDHKVDLYATWSVIQYSIGYNLNGGSISGQSTSYNVTNDFYIPNPSRSGYTFTGWSGTYSGTNLHITAGHTGNISLTANWKSSLYVIVQASKTSTNGRAVVYNGGEAIVSTLFYISPVNETYDASSSINSLQIEQNKGVYKKGWYQGGGWDLKSPSVHSNTRRCHIVVNSSLGTVEFDVIY